MKIARVLELLKIERECVTRQSPCNEKSKLCDRNCGECDIAQNDLELIEMYDFVIRMIETLIVRSQWISVKDNRPKDQKPVIVYVPPHTNRYGDEFIGYVGMAYYTYSVNGGHWCGTDGNVYGAIGAIETPSHWMPLPEPPEVEQDG